MGEIALSQHFTLEEATRSDTAVRLGLDNQPDDATLDAMRAAAEKMELVRQLLGNDPLQVTSWYRSPEVDRAVGGTGRSNGHSSGWCIDFRMYEHLPARYRTPLEICQAIVASDLRYDQLIWEGTWVHISFHPALRQMQLTAHFKAGAPTTYTAGIPA